MAKGQEPLLQTSRPSSDGSSERYIEEEDALLTGTHKSPNTGKHGWAFWREIGAFVWALVATALVIVLAVLYQHQQTSIPNSSKNGWDDNTKPSGKRNLIFMVSDGMGPTSLSLSRSFKQTSQGLPFNEALVLDHHLIGSSRTRSTSSLITDSAAGATAFSCGLKSYNGAISVLPDHQPCGTVLEAAKKAGYMTGLVVTTRITDATPACFAAHVNTREEEDLIAEQMIGEEHPLGRVVDLMLGAGRCHFLPNTTTNSCRDDDKDIVQVAKESGWNYVSDRAGFDGLNTGSAVELPLLGLFADLDIPYEIDRAKQHEVYPSLSEMAETALTALASATQDSEKGFFLMIEGSRIDHAGHGNDPAAQVHEVIEYDKAFSTVLSFLDKSPTQGVLVGTSDHETGGLATARQLHETYPEYHWFPDMLVNATHSSEHLSHELRSHLSTHVAASEDAAKTWIQSQLVEIGLGIHDATDDEIQDLYDSAGKEWPPPSYLFADMISRRAQVGWTSHGHSAVDVNIYASHPTDAKALIGNHENTEIGDFIRDYLDLDLGAISDELKSYTASMIEQGRGSWIGGVDHDDDDDDDDSAREQLDHYHGEFKRGLGCDCGGVH
ncbi:MAG: hypothetical protein Q9164_001672 [Protoblastenia rupestris]